MAHPTPSLSMSVLTKFIRALLKERLKTESQLSIAKRARVSDTSLGDVAAGKRGLGLNVLIGILQAFDLSLSVLDRALNRWRSGTRPASKCLDDESALSGLTLEDRVDIQIANERIREAKKDPSRIIRGQALARRLAKLSK